MKPATYLRSFIIFLTAFLGALASCSKAKISHSAVDRRPVEACSLLTADEIKSVQGEAVVTAKPSGNATVSQCYFAVATPVNSVVLTVTLLADDVESAKPIWDKMLQGGRAGDNARGEEREQQGEAGESARLEKIENVGDEAFWSASRFGGALHVRKANRHLRLSIGGGDDEKTKIKKSKTLAEMALKRI